MSDGSASAEREVEYTFADSDGHWLYDQGRLVKVKINDTEFTCTTDTDGVAEFTRDFQPVNNSPTTYTITASYDGGWPLSATAYANTLDGNSYAECTTIQYGHKPSSNSTVLTVSPRPT